MAKKLTVKQLGQILREEFDHDSWGDVDPFYFQNPPRAEGHPDFDPDNDGGEMGGLYEVLERVVNRLNNLK